MKTFDWTSFNLKIAVKANLSTMYNAWTKPQEIERWFLSKSTFFDKEHVVVNPANSIESNYTYEWSWYLYDIVEKGNVTAANGKDFLQFTFAGECLVDINLKEQADYVIVELTQKNIPTDDDSKQGIRLGCHSGWSFYLLNLKSVYEGGIDLRNKNSNFRGMVNN